MSLDDWNSSKVVAVHKVSNEVIGVDKAAGILSDYIMEHCENDEDNSLARVRVALKVLENASMNWHLDIDDLINDVINYSVSCFMKEEKFKRAALDIIDTGASFEADLGLELKEDCFSLASIAWFSSYYRVLEFVMKEIRKEYEWSARL